MFNIDQIWMNEFTTRLANITGSIYASTRLMINQSGPSLARRSRSSSHFSNYSSSSGSWADSSSDSSSYDRLLHLISVVISVFSADITPPCALVPCVSRGLEKTPHTARVTNHPVLKITRFQKMIVHPSFFDKMKQENRMDGMNGLGTLCTNP